MSTEHKSRAIDALDKLYEFEQEPVSEANLQPGRYFAASFAGEHVAGTEFVIGALFVSWGATAKDIFLGLLLGNLMAVLTWAFVCAPIAVQTRLTLYWYLRRIAGPVTTAIYNILNAILFCILAGCMITVSASAIRIPLGIPEQTKWYPDDFRFVLLVLLVGAVVVALAVLGFKRLAQFAEVCSPWMLLMFIAGAVVMLPALADKVLGHQIASFQDFWQISNKSIWTGVRPDGGVPIGLWHIAAFAWICNLAMHMGLADMALLRYAKKASYGLYSACGMYLGHYLAWVCAGIMGAAAAFAVGRTISDMDAGGVAWQSLGTAGIIAVVLAGWTTSNPTLYRAGLAFQAITPGWPRWLVTLITGILTTIIACFPFVFTKLLNFVGLYGLLLMPVGVIVFEEHWIFPKIGLTQYWAARKKLMLNWPALASWTIAVATALFLERTGRLHLFFLFIPTWLLTAVLYLLFAAIAGAREKLPELVEQNHGVRTASAPTSAVPVKSFDVMTWIFAIISAVTLIICTAMSLWVYFSPPDAYERNFSIFKAALLWPSLVYFVAATAWAVRHEK
jgi:cytosine permease